MATLTNAQVRKALRASIKKWRDIEAGKIADKGRDNCALCQMFIEDTGSCKGCPIAAHTQEHYCRCTPHVEFDKVSNIFGFAHTPEAKAAAREMRMFLEMLDRKYFVEGVTVK